MTVTPPAADDALLEDWLRRVRIMQDAHNVAERAYDRMNAVLGVANVASITVLGVVAASLDLTVGNNRWVAVALTGVGAVSAALLILLNFGTKAALSLAAARNLGSLRRSIELVQVTAADNPERAFLFREVRRQWDFISSVSPNVPEVYRQRARDGLLRNNARH